MAVVLVVLLLFAVARGMKGARPYAGTTPTDFVWWIGPHATTDNRRTGIPAAVTIAQAMLESGNGKSRLTRDHHNLFGIKAGSSWRGRVVSAPTWERIGGVRVEIFGDWSVYPNREAVPAGVDHRSLFRVYASPADSLTDHSRVLYNGFYSRALSVRHDSEAFAHALTGVYATDDQYGDSLVRLMRQHDLERFDVAPAAWALDPSVVPSAWLA